MLDWLRSLIRARKVLRPESPQDLCRPPVSFGYKSRWLAVPSRNGNDVAETMGLREPTPCSWERGIDEAYNLRRIFVTPVVEGWTFVLGPIDNEDGVPLELLKSLSRIFGKAYYFATHRVVELHAWGVAEKGEILRAFDYVGESGEFRMNSGERLPEEIELGTGVVDDENTPDEEIVLTLASLWTLDPRELEQYSTAVGPGMLYKQDGR